MKILSNKSQLSGQDILLATIHELDCVIEVYLNREEVFITELIHHTDSRITVYQYEFDKYISESGNFKAIDEKITEML